MSITIPHIPLCEMDGTVNLFSRGGQKREISGLAVLLDTVQNFCPNQIFARVTLLAQPRLEFYIGRVVS